jgi:glycylpeptide N-tetradecanoyltransferase
MPGELGANLDGPVFQLGDPSFAVVTMPTRSKRLAPVLIKEITRRVNLTDRWQAVYTAGVVLPRPVGRCRYWHRSLNPKKLIEVRAVMCFACILHNLARHRSVPRYYNSFGILSKRDETYVPVVYYEYVI